MKRFQDLAFVVLLLAAASLAVWLSFRVGFRSDWSFAQRGSLTSATRDTLAQFQGPVEVVSYARDEPALREAVSSFVARYQQLKPDLALRFVNPDADPAAMRSRAITIDGELEIGYAGRHERLTHLSERAFSGALSRLLRPHARVIAFVAGHGERKPSGERNADLGRFAAALAEQGARALELDLAHAAQIPENTDLLVLASPDHPLADAEQQILVDYLDRGGALLWLTEPGGDATAASLAKALGVSVLAGTLVDAAAQGLGIGDPSFLAPSEYPKHAATDGFALTMLLPQAAALAARNGGEFAAAPLLRSSARSWNETGKIEADIKYDAGTAEIPGPLDYGLALTRLSPSPARAEQRVAVIGDGDFLSDRYIGNGGNRDFGLRLVNWLIGDESLVDIRPAEAPDRELALGPRALAALGFGSLFGVPLALLAMGAWLAARRRRS